MLDFVCCAPWSVVYGAMVLADSIRPMVPWETSERAVLAMLHYREFTEFTLVEPEY